MLNSDLTLKYKGSMGSDIPSKDFNDYINMGIYYNGGTNSGFTNVPHAADNGYLIVFKSTRSRQIWIGGFSMAFSTRYMKNTTTWSEWTNIIS